MKVIVCLKQVPDPSVIEFDIQSGELRPLHWLLNPLDFIALEEALRLKETRGASVTAVSVGPERAEVMLRQALTYGADWAIRFWHANLEGADTWAVSAVLAAVVSKVGFDLILCGARSADNGSEFLGACLATRLNVPLVTRVVSLEWEEGTVVAHSRGERGWRETFQAPLPAVLTVEEGLNEPRYVPILSRVYRQGLKRPIEVWGPEDGEFPRQEITTLVQPLGLIQPRPRTKVGVKVSGLSIEERLRIMRGEAGKGKKEVFQGAPVEAARKIVAKLAEWLS